MARGSAELTGAWLASLAYERRLSPQKAHTVRQKTIAWREANITSVPLAPGEQWGQRWEFNTLVEDRDLDFARATLEATSYRVRANQKVNLVTNVTNRIVNNVTLSFGGELAMIGNASADHDET